MSRILLPNGNGLESRSLKRGSDFVTMDEIIQLIGPQAKLLVEQQARIDALEAQLGMASPETPDGDIE